MKRTMSSLGWWLDHLPVVVNDITTTRADLVAAYKCSYYVMLERERDPVRFLASLGNRFDKWLENPLENCCTDLDGLLDAAKRIAITTRFEAHAILVLRTVFFGLKKWGIDDDNVGTASDSDSALAEVGFCDRQRAIRLRGNPRPSVQVDRVLKEAKWLLSQVFASESWETALLTEKPRTGPGAVSEKLNHVDRWGLILKEEMRRSGSPNTDFDPLLTGTLSEGLSCNLSDESFSRLGVAKLCAVPKDMWKKRLISVEPAYSGFVQQYLRAVMIRCMYLHGTTSHLVKHLATGFGDQQQPQRDAAVQGSRGYGWSDMAASAHATLDFSDASDNITLSQVEELFPTHVVQPLKSCRSFYYRRSTGTAEDRGLQALYSYAGMGNATTFIVEMCMFWAIFESLRRITQGIRGPVLVYGDDVIVPVELMTNPLVYETLEHLGWKLNLDKSFYAPRGLFRESCGVQAFNGQIVTCERFKGYRNNANDVVALCQRIRDVATTLPSLAALLLCESGIRNYVGAPPSSVSVDVSWLPRTKPPKARMCPDLQRLQFLDQIGVPSRQLVQAEDRSLCFAWFLGYIFSVVEKCRKGDRRIFRRALKPGSLVRLPVPHRVSLETKWLNATTWGRSDI